MVVFYAAESSGGGGGLLVTLLPLLLLFGVMYFLMIRPQQRRRREAEQLQATLGPGDEVITIGGLYGTIVDVDDETVTLEIAPDVHARYARPAINRVVAAAEHHDDDEADEEDDATPDEQSVAPKVIDRGDAKD